MSESKNEPHDAEQSAQDATGDLADHERPDVGLIGDEDLPEELQPSDDNPLAKDPDDESGASDGPDAPRKVEGMPDMGSPGAAG